LASVLGNPFLLLVPVAPSFLVCRFTMVVTAVIVMMMTAVIMMMMTAVIVVMRTSTMLMPPVVVVVAQNKH
jgi:hypothetical protein